MVNAAETIAPMSIAAALVLAAAAAPQAPTPGPGVQARASARVIRAQRITRETIAQFDRQTVSVHRDAAGTVWIEFS